MKGVLLATTVASFVVSAAAYAQTPLETKSFPAEKMFPFLADYLKLPAAERDRFHPNYHMMSQGLTVRATLKRKSGDVPVTFAPDGLIRPVPTPADIAAKTQIEMSAPKDSKIGISIKLASSVPPATTMDAKALKASIEQARVGAKKAAGAMSMMVPNLQRVCFEGATGGQAVLGNGKTVALKTETQNNSVDKGSPCFTPKDAPDAVQIRLDRVPRTLIILK
jgi:hypothetical protein